MLLRVGEVLYNSPIVLLYRQHRVDISEILDNLTVVNGTIDELHKVYLFYGAYIKKGGNTPFIFGTKAPAQP